jgi:VWFA-related protein
MRKRLLITAVLFCVAALWPARPAAAQYPNSQAKSVQQSSGAPVVGEQEGPNKGVDETVIRPRKGPSKAPAPPPPQPKKEDKINPDEAYTLRADVELVNISVVLQDKNGQFIPGLKKEQFHITEDGAPQTIRRSETQEAAMTVAMVIEFSSLYWQFLYQTMEASYGFVQSLRPEDWVAVIAFDIRPEILQDFTKNKAAAFGALNMMRIPGFSESNLFDALGDAIKRMDNIDGKKAILLISSGIDTFSKTRYDQLLKQVQASDTPVYAIGTGQAVREYYDARGAMGGSTQIGFLQADNQLRSFSRLSGGKAYFPRFEGQFPEIYNDISASLRNEYNLSYNPTNTAHDGKFRKVKVEITDADGKPLKLVDQKGKEIKYEIRAKEGYYAPRPVE